MMHMDFGRAQIMSLSHAQQNNKVFETWAEIDSRALHMVKSP